MLSAEQNDLITRTGPGTPAGALMRRYWQPAALVVCEDGEKDVFLHISVVERAGLRSVNEGQRLAMKVVNTQKGREAVSFTLID
jgi:cold shock CspA family protein